MDAIILQAEEREKAKEQIKLGHYTHSVPSGKSHYIKVGEAIVVWSIPANAFLSKFLLRGAEGSVWELSRLWAPDGHEPNLLTRAISAAIRAIKNLEKPDLLVSYADPNAGHSGGIYKAASWIFNGQSEETRAYRGPDGEIIARRAFHSGSRSLKKAEIEAKGFKEVKLPGKLRFIKPITRKAKRIYENTSA